jgi:hypothetical protein
MSILLAAAQSAEETRELPVPPLVVGLLALGILMLLLFVTLSFGKGRPHT